MKRALSGAYAGADIAADLGLDRSFSRLFYAWTPLTPKDYLQDVRLRYATSMASSQKMGMNVIAAAAGYKDVYNFSAASKAEALMKELSTGPCRSALA